MGWLLLFLQLILYYAVRKPFFRLSLRFSQGVHRVHRVGGTLGMQRDPHSHRVLHAQVMIRLGGKPGMSDGISELTNLTGHCRSGASCSSRCGGRPWMMKRLQVGLQGDGLG